jgi:hypothetical protein
MRREVTLDGDLGGWPLYVDEREDLDDLVGASLPSDWPMLSGSLKQDLVSWNDEFFARKTSRARASQLVSSAHELVARVQAELGDEYIVRSRA